MLQRSWSTHFWVVGLGVGACVGVVGDCDGAIVGEEVSEGVGLNDGTVGDVEGDSDGAAVLHPSSGTSISDFNGFH